MLHILLLILKWIGIIIAAILGILVLLICIVFFVPVRYEIQGKSEGTLDSLKGKIKVTWFLHLFRTDVYYKEKRLKWRLRFAFFKRTSGVSVEREIPEDSIDAGRKSEEKKLTEGENHEKEQKASSKKLDEENQEVEKTSEKAAVDEKSEKITDSKSISEECEENEENVEEIQTKGKRFLQKIKDIYEKIKCTFKNFCDKIKEFIEKKEKLVDFIEDEVHRNAVVRLKKELFWYLGKLKPKKLEAQVRFGFEDPYYTGKVLAYLGVLYPFIGEHTEIAPDFEQKILKGRIYVNGRVRVSHLAHLAWKLFWDKNIRKSYKDIKNFKL